MTLDTDMRNELTSYAMEVEVKQNIKYEIRVYHPTNISLYQNVTLHLEMERVSLKNILSEEGRDNIRVAK